MAAKKKSNKNVEKVRKTVKGIGDKVAKTSKKLYSLADLNIKKVQLESANEESFKQIGMLAYKRGGLTGKMKEIGDKVKTNKQDLVKLKAKIKRLKGVKKDDKKKK